MYTKTEKNYIKYFTIVTHVLGCEMLIIKVLKSHINYLLQIRVQAYDGGVPSLSATATIDVLVQRNLYSPVFSVLNYEVTINENAALGVPFVYVNATDADIRVCDVDIMFSRYKLLSVFMISCHFTIFGSVFKPMTLFPTESPQCDPVLCHWYFLCPGVLPD